MPIQYQQKLHGSFHAWHRADNLPKMPQHMHRNVEIIYLKSGSATCTVDLVTYELTAGDILFVFSEQLHSYETSVGNPENYALLFPPDIPIFNELFATMLPVSPVLHGAANEELDMLFKAARKANHEKSSELAKGEVMGYIAIILAKILPQLPLKKKSDLVNKIEYVLIRYCAENYTKPITLNEIAKKFGYTPEYFSRIFNEKYKTSFTNFINSLRVEEAKSLLKKSDNITEVAFACGFSSIRNFNRVFKQKVGKTPYEYRRAKKDVQ